MIIAAYRPSIHRYKPLAIPCSAAQPTDKAITAVETYLNTQARQLKLKDTYFVRDWYTDSSEKVVCFKWGNGYREGILAGVAAKNAKKLGFAPASEASASKALIKAGYHKGYPVSNKGVTFDRNVFAFTLPVDKCKLSSQRTYLIAANIDYGEYHDKCSYLEFAANAFGHRLRDLGALHANPQLSIYHRCPALNPKPDEPIFTISVSYDLRRSEYEPSQRQLKKALLKMPEIVLTSKIPQELKKSEYAGYNGKPDHYPNHVYALDLTRLPGFKADKQYPQYVLVEIEYSQADAGGEFYGYG